MDIELWRGLNATGLTRQARGIEYHALAAWMVMLAVYLPLRPPLFGRFALFVFGRHRARTSGQHDRQLGEKAAAYRQVFRKGRLWLGNRHPWLQTLGLQRRFSHR